MLLSQAVSLKPQSRHVEVSMLMIACISVVAGVLMGEPASSSIEASAKPNDKLICGDSFDSKDGGDYEFQWHMLWNRVSKNENGTSDWARIIHTTNPAYLPKTMHRIHRCKFNPCRAWWQHVSKYGDVGPKYIYNR